MQATAAKTKKPVTRRESLIALVVLIALVWVAGAWCSNLLATPKSTAPAVGHEGHLTNPSGATIAMGTSADILGEAVQATAVKDTVGLQRIMASGQFVQVASGTRVLVTDGAARMSVGMSKVRLLDGPQLGQSGWVLDNSLTP